MPKINFFYNGSGDPYPGTDLVLESNKYFYWQTDGDLAPFVESADWAVWYWFQQIRDHGRFQHEWPDHMERLHHCKWMYMYLQMSQEGIFRSPVVINDGTMSVGLGRTFVSAHLLPRTIKPSLHVSETKLHDSDLTLIENCEHLVDLLLEHTAWKNLYRPGMEWVMCLDKEKHHIYDIDCERPDEWGSFRFAWFHEHSPEDLYQKVRQRILDLPENYDAVHELKQMIIEFQCMISK